MPAKIGMAEYIRLRYHARRNEAIQTLGGCCKWCGSKDSLELDHIDPAQKSFYIGRLWSCSREKFEAELSKCQLLCSDCHHVKTVRERGFKIAKGTHGTLSAYRYCRCDICKKAKSEYSKKVRLLKLGVVTQVVE